MTDTQGGFEEIQERPSWQFPLTLFVVTVLFGLGIWWYYLGYSIDDLTGNTVSGTERGRILHVTIGGHPLEVPANYTQYPKDRRDGTREELELFTVLPDFAPYSRAREAEFLSDAVDSPVVIFKIAAYDVALTETQRVEYYIDNLVDGAGIDTDFGLLEFTFERDSSFHDQDMFVFKTATGLYGMIRCLRRSETLTTPFCWRETELGEGLNLHYRFRRAHLPKWQMIDRNVLDLIGTFAHVDRTKPAS